MSEIKVEDKFADKKLVACTVCDGAAGSVNWTEELNAAIARGCIRCLDLAVKHDGKSDLNAGLCRAARVGNIVSMRFMLERGATDLRGALVSAAEGDHVKAIQLLITSGAPTRNLRQAMYHAASENSVRAAWFLLNTFGGSDKALDINEALGVAKRCGHDAVAAVLERHGAEWDDDTDANRDQDELDGDRPGLYSMMLSDSWNSDE